MVVIKKGFAEDREEEKGGEIKKKKERFGEIITRDVADCEEGCCMVGLKRRTLLRIERKLLVRFNPLQAM